ALLARSYLHGFQSGGGDELARVCRETLDWMLAEMPGDEGGFCSALDADSEGDNGKEEGFFYSWTIEEFRAVCGDHADAMCGYFGVIDHGELDGRNVLRVAAPERRPADEVFSELRTRLLAARAGRERPFRDEKRITAWNALAIAALAEAGRVLGEPRYVQAAVAAAEFVEAQMRCADGSLLRSWLDGRDGPQGFLEDHAYVVGAWLSLYEATGDDRWFVLAQQTADQMIERFGDPEGGFFTTSSDAERLLVRRKDLDDNPIPSGNSAAALGLLRLAALTGKNDYREAATKTLSMLQPLAAKYPTGFANALQAIAFALAPTREVALVGDNTAPLLAVVDERYRPNLVVASTTGTNENVPLLFQRAAVDGQPTAYVCEGFTCKAPVTEPDALRTLLGE
ncbi:MAG: thioredoxin domain-containing protein, partial [Thermoleophilaceae bacterium]|nr:thioredoxin domain-containing protein [Thermoleophilaceae bacterium]